MIIVMEENAAEEQIVAVVDRLVQLGFDIHRSTGARYTILGAVGSRLADLRGLELLKGVNKVVRVSSPYKLAARAFRPEGTRIVVGKAVFGESHCALIAGPGTIESRSQLELIADALVSRGLRILAGNVTRSSTDPFGFQGLGEEGLRILREVAAARGLVTSSEISSLEQLPLFERYVDLIRVGAHDMKNFNLLRELARQGKPVILTRGESSTIEELLISADYLLSSGNQQVILCEAGIRTFENYTRLTLDIAAPPIIHKLSHLPVIVDPCHSSGRRDKIIPLSRAALAAGADGVLIELHHDPDRALCDGAQSLTIAQFHSLMDQVEKIAPAVEKLL
ncbi:MAG: 3-deoxy-7-phosphoheptulonate synthase [Acidobacteriota bacterium]